MTYTEWTETTVDTNHVAQYCESVRANENVKSFIVVANAIKCNEVTVVYCKIVEK